jgi:hypothetical protein
MYALIWVKELSIKKLKVKLQTQIHHGQLNLTFLQPSLHTYFS